jgi:hypothetical protein
VDSRISSRLAIHWLIGQDRARHEVSRAVARITSDHLYRRVIWKSDKIVNRNIIGGRLAEMADVRQPFDRPDSRFACTMARRLPFLALRGYTRRNTDR